MPTIPPSKYFLGQADAVAQIATIQITAFDAATTYSVTIGGVTVSAGGNTDVNTTASDLQIALAASMHPYFAAITWSVLTATITATSSVPGVPFLAASSVSGGTGTVGVVTTATINASPNDWATPANWSDGVVPVNGDNITLSDSNVNICWGLDQNAIDLTALTIMASYTGRIGLDRTKFATSADGEITSTTEKEEYRDHYLKIKYTTLDVGEHVGPDSPTGSERIKINNTATTASTTTIHNTASSAADTGKPALRLLLASTSADVFVRSAPGGIGIAIDEPNETSIVRKISVSDTSNTSRVFTGEGVTLTEWEQNGGNNLLQAAAAVTTAKAKNGTLTIEGDFTVTTLVNDGATIIDNHIKTAGAAVGTAQLNAGITDTTQSTKTRTYTTVELKKGAAFIRDEDNVVLTNGITPKGRVTVQAA